MTTPANPRKQQLSDEFTKNVIHFIESVPPRRLHKDVLYIFMMFLQEDAGLPADFHDVVTDLYLLFEFLDHADKEMQLLRELGEIV